MNHKALAIAVLTLAALAIFGTLNQDHSSAYSEWKKTYGATWDESEDVYRKIIFERNVEIINKHNADESQTYKMAINQFTAMTDE